MADEYSRLAAHNLSESMKIRGWRDNLLNRINQQAARQVTTRPTTIHDQESIAWALARTHPKLDEYGAGLQITERRAALFASMATDLRLQILADLLTGQSRTH
jgi:hypothetical protein